MIRLFLTALIALPLLLSAQNTSGQPPKQVYRKVTSADLTETQGIYYFKGNPYTGVAIDNYPNGAKMMETNYVNGILSGTVIEYYADGSIKTQVTYLNGVRNGYFAYFYDNGKLMTNGSYKNDLLDSTINSFYKNGRPKFIQHYETGVKTGNSISYFKNGNVEQKSFLIKGVPHGTVYSYYEAGNLRSEANYNMGVREGKSLTYHLTGSVAEEAYYYDGYKDSVCKYWDNVFGSLMKIEYYNKGKKDGMSVSFNEAGDTLEVYNFKENILDGPYRKYYSSVVELGDKKNGKTKKYNPKKSNKQFRICLDEYGYFVDGKRDGVFKAGLCNRNNHVEGQYALGIKVGEWRYYNDQDKQVLYEKYDENGVLIKQDPPLNLTPEGETEEE